MMVAASTDIDRASESNRLKGLTILLVEDDFDSRELLGVFLEEMGATCLSASSGNVAFPLFTEKRPQLVVSDLWMPDGDGFELIRKIRALGPDQGGLTPAIAVSAASNTEEALMAGYHVLIPKPYHPVAIIDAIAEFLRPEDRESSVVVPWTVSSPASGAVVVAFAGHVRVSDMRACTNALLHHLRKGSCDVVVDFRQLTGFSLAAASAAEQTVWPMRHALRSVRIIGGPRAAQLVAAAACRFLGLRYSVESG